MHLVYIMEKVLLDIHGLLTMDLPGINIRNIILHSSGTESCTVMPHNVGE